jgi:nucleoside-diphosphate kinase
MHQIFKSILVVCLCYVGQAISYQPSQSGALEMGKERTLSIIKPDAVSAHHIGEIISRFEKANLRIVAAKMCHLTEAQAQAFYAVHRERPFYTSLVKFMTTGPILAMVLEGEDAVAKNRKLMGATDPAKADPHTIRKDFARSIESNAVHGSDSLENAKTEIAFFFSQMEIQ